MMRLKQYINEMAAVAVTDLDIDFINRAEKISSFNLTEKDFQDLRYKSEIQYLYKKNFFPKFDLDKTIRGDITLPKLQKAIDALIKENRANFLKLFNFEPGGLGPGEVLLYFLCDDAQLGGAGSAGVDLVIGSKKYEIKTANITGDKKYAYGFKLGATFPMADIENNALGLKRKAGLGSGSEINKKDIDAIRNKFPGEWEKIEAAFAKRAYDKYFKNHDILFMHAGGGKAKPGNQRGKAIAIKKIRQKDIGLERYTSRTFKPIVDII